MKTKTHYNDISLKLKLLIAISIVTAFIISLSIGISAGFVATIFAPIFIPIVSVFAALFCVYSYQNRAAANKKTNRRLEKAKTRLDEARRASEKLDEKQIDLNQGLYGLLETTTTMNARLEKDMVADPKPATLKALVGTFNGRKTTTIQQEIISTDPEAAEIEFEIGFEMGLARLTEEQNLTDVLLDKRAVQINRNRM